MIFYTAYYLFRYDGVVIQEQLTSYMQNLPYWARIALDYLGSVVLLWVVIILLGLTLYSGYRRMQTAMTELKRVEANLKMERKEKVAIILSNNIKFDAEEQEKISEFKSFMIDECGELGARYGPAFMDHGLTDISKLLKMDNKDIESILKTRLVFYMCVSMCDCTFH